MAVGRVFRYQDVVILVCSDFGETLGASVGLLLTFAIVFTVAEVVNRLLSVGPSRRRLFPRPLRADRRMCVLQDTYDRDGMGSPYDANDDDDQMEYTLYTENGDGDDSNQLLLRTNSRTQQSALGFHDEL
jgi:hypothetical protein